jgi:hypothetical protein
LRESSTHCKTDDLAIASDNTPYLAALPAPHPTSSLRQQLFSLKVSVAFKGWLPEDHPARKVYEVLVAEAKVRYPDDPVLKLVPDRADDTSTRLTFWIDQILAALTD